MKSMNNLLPCCFWFYFVLKLTVLSHIFTGANGTTFTFINKCDTTIWPGILSNSGSPKLDPTGFDLPSATSRSLQAPTGWSGRFWARTGCTLNPSSNLFYCATADCGSGAVECSGAGAEPPATLAEFTLGSSAGGDDFYDVSLVDGYNIPLLVEASGGSGQCASTGCLVDLNRACPTELRAGDGGACKSACEAFGTAEYCCSGAYGTPQTCRPTVYSAMFKAACPRSYSYAYDDATSTFTCNGGDYTLTFCPSTPSQKSTRDPTTTPPVTTTPPPVFTGSDPTGETSTSTSTSTPGSDGLDMTYGSATGEVPGAYTTPGTDTDDTGSGTTTTAMLSDGSWLAGLAMGDSTTLRPTQLLTVLSSILAVVVLAVLSL